MEEELRSNYQLYIDKCIESAKKSGLFVKKESALTEEEFVCLIADTGITNYEQRDYNDPWNGIIRPLLSRIASQEIEQTELSYGMRKIDSTPTTGSTYVLANNNRQIIVKKDGKGSLQISAMQYCEEGVYEFFISNNSNRFCFRFYPNTTLETASKKFGKPLDEIKRRFVSNYSYDLLPSKVWMGDDSWMMQGMEQISYSMDIKEDEYAMIANKLFREGLDKVFNSRTINITPEEREYYKQKIEKTKKRVIIISAEELLKDKKRVIIIPAEKEEIPVLSEEERKKEELLEQLQSEGKESNVVNQMIKETKLLEQLSTVMPLSDMQKVVLKLNKIYLDAYENAKKKIELKQEADNETIK